MTSAPRSAVVGKQRRRRQGGQGRQVRLHYIVEAVGGLTIGLVCCGQVAAQGLSQVGDKSASLSLRSTGMPALRVALATRAVNVSWSRSCVSWALGYVSCG